MSTAIAKATARNLADDLEAFLVRAIRRAVTMVKNQTAVDEIEAALGRGDIQSALDAVTMEVAVEELEKVIPRALRSAYEAAGDRASSRLERQLGAGISVRFDVLNPEAVTWIRDRAAELIRTFGKSSLQAIRDILSLSYRTGVPPGKVARMIAESGIGLTPRQAQALDTYRRGLEKSPARFNEEKIADMVRAYGDRLLRQRARLIARTEILRAQAEGNRELWRQAKERGLLPPGAEVEWKTTGQENVCPICDELDEETVPAGGTFSVGVEGPPLHPACSCVLIMHPYGKGKA